VINMKEKLTPAQARLSELQEMQQGSYPPPPMGKYYVPTSLERQVIEELIEEQKAIIAKLTQPSV